MSKPTYTPTTWIDHVEDPATGEVTTLGTEVNAAHLNNMEQGIQAAINAIGQTDADLSGRDAKATIADTDAFLLADSEGENPSLMRVLWSTVKARIKGYLEAVFVPLTRTVNDKALSADIALTADDVGAAASSHSHAAGDITSGTLGLARGGTGAATAAAARTNLGAGAASGLATLDANAKVAAAQASARIVYKSASATLALAEAGCFVYVSSTSNLTITVPANSAVAFPIGTEVELCRWNTGTLSVAPASGVTLLSADNARKIDAKYGVACLKKINTDTWLLSGCLGT
ncbi:hypothetical protein SAMN02910435_02561 [Ruminococcaceae bacterium D5]|nr:hypothetical protein SAMN02910435_02561 [Ruminococcaceae bacterium D5]